MSELKSPRVLLFSVGGSAPPVIFTLKHHRPDYVWFFCSENSREEALNVYRTLIRENPDWNLTADYIIAQHFEELNSCFSELRKALPGLLSKWKVSPHNVSVDYTGGTKTMSAALVLASVEFFRQFSYIGGEQRDKKNGMGVTIDGREKVFYQGNPWDHLAVREVERARDLWNDHNYDAAAETLETAAQKVDRIILFQTVATLARGLAARHRLDFKHAQTLFGQAAEKLPPLLDGRAPDHTLTSFALTSARLCKNLWGKSPDGTLLLHELLDNTRRTAAQKRFEDAAARLYRCMEMQLQIWLEEKTRGYFKNGACSEKRIPATWPPGLEPLSSLKRHPEWGGIQLTMKQIVETLHSLHDTRVAPLMEDYSRKNKSRIQEIAGLRNQGILAHGTQPVSEEGFDKMKDVASEFFQFDLSEERNPIPRLDPRWLDAALP